MAENRLDRVELADERSGRSEQHITPSRKRSRKCFRSKQSTRVMVMFATTFTMLQLSEAFLLPQYSAFSLPPERDTLLQLDALRSPTASEPVKQLRPKSSSSTRKRDEAVKAMKRTQVETALDGVDAQMLELLSDQFLYPNKSSKSVPPKGVRRPKGRPAYVPGAMKYETLRKFREGQELAGQVHERLSDEEVTALVDANLEPSSGESAPMAAATNKVKRKVKGSSTTKATLPEGLAVAPKKKGRKRVVKNLPERKDRLKHNGKVTIRRGKAKGSNVELQKYYRTELLSAEEEYTLGVKVQLMVKCEEVHEGLALHLMRLPTIEEWANACGYTDDDPDYVPTEGLEQIRPAGSGSLFEEVDPNMFVGNGLAQTAGPGRGRGRAKKPPPMQLNDFYEEKDGKRRNESRPLNRGTTYNFVDMMLDARQAKQRMVQSNMRLVVSIARKYSNVGVNLQDLVQEGSLGLSRATEKFDPSRGFKFSTYASWWIQQAVFRSIAYHSRTIRLPVHVHNLLNRVRKVRGNLERDLGRQPTNEEMAHALDMTLPKYNKMLRLTRRSLSLELPKYKSNPKDLGHESEDLLGDTISASSQEDDSTPQTSVDRGLFHDDLLEMLEILDEDERNVIRYRYGLADGLTRTVTAVAAQMKQSKAWVRSQECKALRKLRRPWYEKKLKEHQDALTC